MLSGHLSKIPSSSLVNEGVSKMVKLVMRAFEGVLKIRIELLCVGLQKLVNTLWGNKTTMLCPG